MNPAARIPAGRSAPAGLVAEVSRKSDVTRQRILQAAARVFRQRGYSGARLSDIADAAGMKAGSLYYYYDSKEALVEEVVLEGVRQAREAALDCLNALPPGTSGLERLEALIETHLTVVLMQSDLCSASVQLTAQVPQDIRERTLGMHRAYGAIWRQALQAARDAGEIRPGVNLSAIRMSILGALNWASDWYRPAGASQRQIARDVATMVLRGLAFPGGAK